MGGLRSAPEVPLAARSVKFLALDPGEQVDAAEGPLDQFGQLRHQRVAAAEFVRHGAGGGLADERAERKFFRLCSLKNGGQYTKVPKRAVSQGVFGTLIYDPIGFTTYTRTLREFSRSAIRCRPYWTERSRLQRCRPTRQFAADKRGMPVRWDLEAFLLCVSIVCRA